MGVRGVDLPLLVALGLAERCLFLQFSLHEIHRTPPRPAGVLPVCLWSVALVRSLTSPMLRGIGPCTCPAARSHGLLIDVGQPTYGPPQQ